METDGLGRVLLVADYGASGGTRTYAHQLLDFYGSHGASVLLVASHPDPDPQTEALVQRWGFDYSYRSVVAQTRRDRGRINSCWSLSARRREAAAFRAIGRRFHPDITVASTGTPGALIGALAAGGRRLYLIHTYPHGLRQRLLGGLYFGGPFRDIDGLVTVSRGAMRGVTSMWGLDAHADNQYVIHSTAGPAIMRPPSDHRSLVLTIGHVESYKGPREWIDMVDRVTRSADAPGIRFIWAGSGGLLPACREEVARRGLGDRCEFIGHCDDVGALFDQALIYVQPSRVESLGLALLDATRRGIPSVANSVGGIPEVVIDEVTGYVVSPGSGERLAMSVLRLLMNPPLAASFGLAAHERYRANFTPERWAAEMDTVHQGLPAA